ncbi:tetratricopeptide repeat protein [Pandoraea sputorum]|uniref:tetratricopeptide repeat protein n=1 Tax=Pandoraea sputorum TaxID=93222 RepID=UPI00123FE810|nr:tetratricopeptide repeat protein [Pandoraea sputorum]VVE33931.1 hypothetical protein PSP20601_03782 [Pandoraea sputorum]
MSLVSRLLDLLVGAKAPGSTTEQPISAPARAEIRPATPNASVQNHWLTVQHPAFFGKARFSPNKRWIVGCNDSDGNGKGGFREGGNGRVVLVDQQADNVLHELTCFARPTDAAVADPGTYIVLDSGFGSALQGDIVALDIEGHERFRRRYNANVFNLGLSKCGRYAAIQTASAPNDDGNLLEILDLDSGAAVFGTSPVTGWADKYSFKVDAKGRLAALIVEHKHLGRFRYSGAGQFQDLEAFQAARLDKGDYATKIMAARDLLKNSATPESAHRALNAVQAALAEGANDRPDWAAEARRAQGEAYELLDQLPEALEAYDRALSLDPKIGVQRRASSIRKKLAL